MTENRDDQLGDLAWLLEAEARIWAIRPELLSAITDLRKNGASSAAMQPGFEAAMQLLEEGEKRLFKRYGGKYVDTGALMASLTQPLANDAIRDAHAQHADFGTSVWYARFQKDKKGKSAVLKLQPKERKLIPPTLLSFVSRGIEGMLH